jgi:radical SAM protein with 4Fe4S-binding SPASM domain
VDDVHRADVDAAAADDAELADDLDVEVALEAAVRLGDGLRFQLGEPTGKSRAQTKGTRDGKGIVFVAHDGDVYPAGFLPLSVGNVREESLVEIYRDSELLRRIRAAEFAGGCGTCDYAEVCGGSRARAYAASGDPLGADPACVYA